MHADSACPPYMLAGTADAHAATNSVRADAGILQRNGGVACHVLL